MTLGALTVAVGLLADDAIIVLESIFHRWEQGAAHWEGVRQGLRDIAGPDVSGTLTTVAVFMPLIFVGGLAGLFFIPFAWPWPWRCWPRWSFVEPNATVAQFHQGQAACSAHWAGAFSTGARSERASAGLGDTLSAPEPGLWILLLAAAALALVPINFLPLPNEGVLLESFSLPPGSSLPDTEAALRDHPPSVGRIRWWRTRLRESDRPPVPPMPNRLSAAKSRSNSSPASVRSLDRLRRQLRPEPGTGIQVALGTPTLERVGESLSGLPQPFVIRLFG